MSLRVISAVLRQRVAEAGRFRCGYCLTAQHIISPLLEIDHIISEDRGVAIAVSYTPSYHAL
jgi:hypothetical protein